ncbi:MAG: CBS domain-containing protein [Peptococcaceae bacterium]|nr:CBS domain-containing protein [Peptococcaceae bacterium]
MKKSISDIMIKNPITIADNATVQDAIDLFSYYRIGCLPVVDPAGHLVSFLSDGDIIAFLARRTKQQDRIPQIFHATHFSAEDDYKRDEEIVKEMEELSVHYCATKKVQFAYEDDNLAEIATLMDNRRLKHVPVVDHEHKLIGLLSRRDIILAFFDTMVGDQAND